MVEYILPDLKLLIIRNGNYLFSAQILALGQYGIEFAYYVGGHINTLPAKRASLIWSNLDSYLYEWICKPLFPIGHWRADLSIK